MKKIAVVTATRAEYGLLAPIVKELRKYENNELQVELIVTGTHLSGEYGFTLREIRDDKVRIDHQIEIPIKSENAVDISKNQSVTLEKFSELFGVQEYNAVILLGDRYEMLAVAIAAGNTRIPIFHIGGGDTTEGAIDEWIRHSITKISYLHFVTNEVSRKRVIQLGESPERVFNFGSTSVDNILTVADMSKDEALNSIGLNDCNYVLCTYHPVTMESGCVDEQISEFLSAIQDFSNLQFVVTKSNADQGGAKINELLDDAAKRIENLHVYTSLGVRRYLSLMKYAEFVLGNSSSGIIETPVLHVPTVNIGDRQKGRLQSDSIINCEPNTGSIVEAIKMAMSDRHKALCKTVISPYGAGHAAERIAKKTIEIVESERINLKKAFYDLMLR